MGAEPAVWPCRCCVAGQCPPPLCLLLSMQRAMVREWRACVKVHMGGTWGAWGGWAQGTSHGDDNYFLSGPDTDWPLASGSVSRWPLSSWGCQLCRGTSLPLQPLWPVSGPSECERKEETVRVKEGKMR